MILKILTSGSWSWCLSSSCSTKRCAPFLPSVLIWNMPEEDSKSQSSALKFTKSCPSCRLSITSKGGEAKDVGKWQVLWHHKVSVDAPGHSWEVTFSDVCIYKGSVRRERWPRLSGKEKPATEGMSVDAFRTSSRKTSWRFIARKNLPVSFSDCPTTWLYRNGGYTSLSPMAFCFTLLRPDGEIQDMWDNGMRTRLQSSFKMLTNSREAHLLEPSCVIIWEIWKPGMGRDPAFVSYCKEPFPCDEVN